MTRSLPETKPEVSRSACSLSDAKQRAYAALECLLERVGLHKITGVATLRFDINQGGIRRVTLCTEEALE